MPRPLATPDTLFSAIVVAARRRLVSAAIGFGMSEPKAQLTLAIILGFGTALSLYMSLQARLEHLEGQRRQVEFDRERLPSRNQSTSSRPMYGHSESRRSAHSSQS
jgi:hypothetical protein